MRKTDENKDSWKQVLSAFCTLSDPSTSPRGRLVTGEPNAGHEAQTNPMEKRTSGEERMAKSGVKPFASKILPVSHTRSIFCGPFFQPAQWNQDFAYPGGRGVGQLSVAGGQWPELISSRQIPGNAVEPSGFPTCRSPIIGRCRSSPNVQNLK